MKNTQLLTSYSRRIYRANDPKFYSCIDQPLAIQMSELGTHTLRASAVVLPTRICSKCALALLMKKSSKYVKIQ